MYVCPEITGVVERSLKSNYSLRSLEHLSFKKLITTVPEVFINMLYEYAACYHMSASF